MAFKGTVFAPRVTNHPAMVTNKTAKATKPNPAMPASSVVAKRVRQKVKK